MKFIRLNSKAVFLFLCFAQLVYGQENLIVLQGTSSAGKTSIAKELKDNLSGNWEVVGVDDFVGAGKGQKGIDTLTEKDLEALRTVGVNPGSLPVVTSACGSFNCMVNTGSQNVEECAKLISDAFIKKNCN